MLRAIVACAAIASVPAAFGNDSFDDEVGSGLPPPLSPPPPAPPPANSSVDVKVQANQVMIHAHRHSASMTANWMYMVHTTGDGIKVIVNSDEHSKDDKNASSDCHFNLMVDEILEVDLSNRSAGYQPDVDPIISSAKIGHRNEWAPPGFVESHEVVRDGDQMMNVSAFSVADAAHFFVKGSVAADALRTKDISNTYVKFDFAIRNWKYSPAHPGSVLALKVFLQGSGWMDGHAPVPYINRGGHHEQKLSDRPASTNGGLRGRFSWVTHALHCPWGRSRGSTCLGNSTEDLLDVRMQPAHGKWIYFAFVPRNATAERGDIIWDPEVGADLDAAVPSPSQPGWTVGELVLWGGSAIMLTGALVYGGVLLCGSGGRRAPLSVQKEAEGGSNADYLLANEVADGGGRE
jgi:hypothetical protein